MTATATVYGINIEDDFTVEIKAMDLESKTSKGLDIQRKMFAKKYQHSFNRGYSGEAVISKHVLLNFSKEGGNNYRSLSVVAKLPNDVKDIRVYITYDTAVGNLASSEKLSKTLKMFSTFEKICKYALNSNDFNDIEKELIKEGMVEKMCQ